MNHPFLNPLTRKRLKRFRQTPQAWYSLLIFCILFVISLGAELVCNSRPLLLIQEGRWYFPFLRFYPEDAFLHNGNSAEPDYLSLRRNPEFLKHNPRILFPLSTGDPYRIVPREELLPHLRIRYFLSSKPGVASITVDRNLKIRKQNGLDSILNRQPPADGTSLEELFAVSPALAREIRNRLGGRQAFPRYSEKCSGLPSDKQTDIVIAARKERRRPPKTLRITLREQVRDGAAPLQKGWILTDRPPEKQTDFMELPEDIRSAAAAVLPELTEEMPDKTLEFGNQLQLSLHREAARYPFRPIPGHPFGIDDAGRDILARILYGLRSSLLFGLILVICSMTLGTLAGMLQGYLGGWVDITAQRLIEIWSALPFLYVIILLGSIYGTSFSLLIFCYALFNWIGISYYMRAEMLRLRKMPFVEAAKCLGLPGWKIAWKHILPNAMVPLITFFPFSLVGAIGSLAALDYLGFGLPPPTPSLGQLLQQAQNQRWAYWLILYPALTLFIIMLLGVFIGEGFRNAYDPRKQNRIH